MQKELIERSLVETTIENGGKWIVRPNKLVSPNLMVTVICQCTGRVPFPIHSNDVFLKEVEYRTDCVNCGEEVGFTLVGVNA